jgi:hypothetical protein
MALDIDQLVKRHAEYLQRHHGARYKEYLQILEHAPFSARAEAAVYSMLGQLGGRPYPNVRGFDYTCSLAGIELAVEVTALDSQALDWQTEWSPNGGAFALPAIAETVNRKLGQLGEARMPRVVCVCSEHDVVRAAMAEVAERLLMGRTGITFQPKSPAKPVVSLLGYRDSAFLTVDGDHRKKLSGVLICWLGEDIMRVVGVLNPSAIYPLAPETLGRVPTITVSHEDETSVMVHWCPDRSAAEFHYSLPQSIHPV